MQSSKLALSSLLLRKKRLFQRSPRHAVLFSPSGYLGVKMEKKKNQHYVPQYYFKFFNDRQPFISILLVSKGTVIASSSVADQASKSYFYGDAEIESEVCIVENRLRKHIIGVLAAGSIDRRQKLSLIE